MQEKPKGNEGFDEGSDPVSDGSAWESDQKQRGYYYDDRHGYEVYDPDKDEEDCGPDPVTDERS
jgi:hypothetical protein